MGRDDQPDRPNGLITKWTYDGMGRKITETRDVGTATPTVTEINYRWANPNSALASINAPAGPAYLIETETSGAPPSLAFYDNMDRAIDTFGLNGGNFDGNPRIVGHETQYDAMGRSYWTSLPFYYLDAPAVGSQVTQYDALSRPLEVQTADEEAPGGFVNGTFSYNGLITRTTNPSGQTTITTKNSQGQTVSVVTNADAASATDRGETDYTYDAVGNVLTTQTVSFLNSQLSTLTSFTYDLSGRKVRMTDPDMGIWTYAYDAAGELISQTDAKGQTTTMAYDQLGRLVTRTEAEGNTTWNYDSAPRLGGGVWLGMLASVTAPNSYSESYTYDSLGRPSVTTRNINTAGATAPDIETFTTGQQYDSVGRPTIGTYPGGYQVQNVYNAFGFLKEVSQASPSTGLVSDTTQNQLFWQADSYSIWGGVNGCTYGNGVTEDTIVAATTGRLLGFGIGPNESVAFYGYSHDSLGNLTVRNDDATGRNETYTYDGLNRLTASSLSTNGSPLSTVNVAYDSLGNITSKSDVGAYTYGQNGAGPHAVTQITLNSQPSTTNSYAYDSNGNMVSGSVNVGGVPTPRSIAWTSFNQVQNITQGSHYSTFTFDADHQRATQVTDQGSTVYVGNAFERVTNGSDVQYKFYIFTPTGRSVVRIMDAGTVTTRYLHQDALGSIVAVTDETGAVTERYAYDPWGKQTPLSALNSQPSTLSSHPATTRGFTDHEMLPDLGLIHMNGRVYDPVPGRFLSADPIVQSPSDSQSYNRYSYIMNHPLGGTDPTGFEYQDPDDARLEQQQQETLDELHEAQVEENSRHSSGIPGLPNGLISDGIDQALALGNTEGLEEFASGFNGSLLNASNLTYAFQSSLLGVSNASNNAGAYAVNYNAISGTTTGSVNGQLVAYTLASGAGAGLDQINNQWVAYATMGGTASDVDGGKSANGASTAAFAHSAGSNSAAYAADMAKLDQIEQSRIEGVFGSLAGQREDARLGLAIAGVQLVQNTVNATAITLVAGEFASAGIASDAAAAKNLYTAMKTYEEISATAEVAANYQLQANRVKNAAGVAAGLIYGLATAKNSTDAALGVGGTLADAVGKDIHGVGPAGVVIGVTQATLDYIKSAGISDAQATAVIANIDAQIQNTRQTITQRYNGMKH